MLVKGLTVAEVASKLRCHPNTVKRIEKRLKLEVKRDYRNYRVFTEETVRKIQDYISAMR